MSPGGEKPDLYFSMASRESWEHHSQIVQQENIDSKFNVLIGDDGSVLTSFSSI